MYYRLTSWMFVLSIAFNCAFALVFFQFTVIDWWNWNQNWIFLIAIPVIGLGALTVWSWWQEHASIHQNALKQGTPLRLGFTLQQDGTPLCQLALDLRSIGMDSLHGWSLDESLGEEECTDSEPDLPVKLTETNEEKGVPCVSQLADLS